MTKKTRKDIRFALIDHYLTWYGQLQAHEIGEVLKIERPNAQALIKQFQEQRKAKGKDTIQRNGKWKEPTSSYTPPSEIADAEKFLDHMRGQKLAEQYYSTEQCWDRPEIDLVNLEELGKPKKPNFDVVQQIIWAMKRKHCIEIEYRSRESKLGKKLERRLISPSRLVYVLDRYHLRAYSYTSRGWRDYVLTRITKVFKPETAELKYNPWVKPENDNEWKQRLELTFIPNPKLPDEVIETQKLDYDLKNNELRIECNEATKLYAELRFSRLDMKYEIPQWILKKEKELVVNTEESIVT